MRSAAGPVWMIIPTYFPVVGGAQVQVQQLSSALAAQGWPVSILTRRHSYAHPQGLPGEDRYGGILVRRVFSRGNGKTGSLLFVINGLRFFLRLRTKAIYHAHDTGAAGWLAVAARYLTGGRCLIKLRTGKVAYKQSLRSRITRWQFKALLRLADRVIVVNREVRDYLRSLGIPGERVVWIPNGVDVERFCPASADQKIQACEALGLRGARHIVLYVGRLEYMKGVDVLLRAWCELKPAERAGNVLLLVGDGPEREALEQMAARFQLGSSVIFTGEQQNVQAYYQAADLFVLPSRTEGLSNALIEAMACGLPVVVSDVGGAKDLVDEGQSGCFFPSEDASALAGRLGYLLSIPEAWADYGRAARASVEAKASLAAVARQLEEAYGQLSESMNIAGASAAAAPGER